MYFFPVYNLHIVEQGFFIANRLTVAPFWTLAIEDQFYLFIPWILVFIQRFKGSKTLVLGLGYLACAVFFRVWFKLKFPGTSSDEITKYYAHSLTNYDGLLLGVGFGLIYSPTLNVQISLTLSRIIFFGGMLLVWLLPNCFGSGTDRGRDVLGVYWLVTWISLAMIWVAVRTDHCHMSLIPNGIFRRVLLFLGDRSYVLYLIHMPLAKFVRQGLGWDGFFLFSGYPLVLLFAAELIHSGIERPFHCWGKSKFKPLLASDNFA